MKKKVLSVGLILALASSMMFTSCIGSFALTNKVLSWNKQVGNKFVNTLIFAAFWPIPVYPLTMFADVIVINSIEFWSGSNPVADNKTMIIDGKDAKYQIEQTQYGYLITNLAENTTAKFLFDAGENSWSFEYDGQAYQLLQFVDDTHVKMATPNDSYSIVELSNDGVLAYQEMINLNNLALAK